jgi:hypothetical protein
MSIGESGPVVIERVDSPRSLLQVLLGWVELPLSRRGLPIAFLVVAAGLVLPGWLHPPLSADISSLRLSLGLWPGANSSSQAILHGRSPIPLDSAGLFLLALIAFGILLVYWRPQRLSLATGLLLAGALGVNAAIALNHPALIERLDDEYAQRQQMANLISASPMPNALTRVDNDRIGLPGAPKADEQRADVLRGWEYLGYGRWLVVWAAGGLLLGNPGLLWQRLMRLAAWGGAGTMLAGLMCGPRLLAEYHWLEANRLEGECNLPAARQSLETAVSIFPEFERLERTWLLAGKLDQRVGRSTPARRFFLAYQLARKKDSPRALAYQEDLPWIMAQTLDYREGLQTVPAGFNETLPVGTGDNEAPDDREGVAAPRGPLSEAYRLSHVLENRQALGLLEDLTRNAGPEQPAVRHQAARLWTDTGLRYYSRSPVLTDSGLDYSRQNQNLTSAHSAWQRAAQFAPGLDRTFYQGVVQARIDPTHPERVEDYWQPLLTGLGDQILRADVLATLGDAYFDAGQAATARQRYADSFKSFLLPRTVNYRAQKHMGGL